MDSKYLKNVDPDIFNLIEEEEARQENNIELIASENFTSRAVMEAVGSALTNKYAEGYPHKRYYGGCEVVDKVEDLARDRMTKLFGADHANVQPHSGSSANMAVYQSCLKVGDKILGMDLSNGGHLTHGSPVNFSGILYNFVSYGVSDEDEQIDYNDVYEIALREKPKMIVAGASAYARKIDFKKFREIADEIGAIFFVDMAHIAGLIATGYHENPTPYADFVSTTTHKTLRGPRGGAVLCKEQYAKALDKAVFPGLQGGPLEHVIAGKAVCFHEAMQPEFKDYIGQVVKNCATLADELMKHGYKMVSGGTDNHLMLMNLTDKGITGKQAENKLDEVGITVNKNTVPNETQSPFVTSGIRIGTAAMTTRGFKDAEMVKTAELIHAVLSNIEGDNAEVQKQVIELCSKFPLYK